jgi:hypothetical protein
MDRQTMRGALGVAWALVALVAWPLTALGQSNFMDTRLTWTFGDDDVLSQAGETFPDNPLPNISDRDAYELFYENLNTRYDGRENISHLVLYKSVPSFLDERLTVDLAAVLLVDFAALYGSVDSVASVFRDDGSYIRLVYNWSRTRPSDGLELVLFPLSSERFRVGYLWDLSWGGGSSFTRNASWLSPAIKLQVQYGNLYAFLGLKTAVLNQEVEVPVEGEETETTLQFVSETNYGGLGGLGLDALPWLRFDLSGGFFQMGTFPISGLRAQPVYGYGGAVRLVFHQGIPIETSPDFLLYRNDPAAVQALATREQYVPGQFSWSLSLEGHVIGQHLAFREATGQTREQMGWAAALQLALKYGYLRAHVTGLARDAAFMLQCTPSLVPFLAIEADGVTVTPEYWGALGVDYYFARPRLTLGGSAGVQIPAFYEAETSNVGWVLDDHGFSRELPAGDDPTPVIASRVFLQWDAASILSLLLSVQYVRDANHTRRSQTAYGDRLVYTDADSLGFFLTAQGRF